MANRAALHLITGFLGSGKTTVLNGLLRSLTGKRVGVIVNEWGKIGVDGSLLADPSGLGIVEVAGGQIFCACLSGAFIKAAATMAARGVDHVLVETSGLAKPSNLLAIVDALRREAVVDYRGMIGVVDASRFLILRRAASAVDEQVVHSDQLVIAKADLADAATVAAVRSVLAELRPKAEIWAAVNGAIDPAILEAAPSGDTTTATDERFKGWGAAGRPASASIRPAAPLPRDRLERFLRTIAGDSYRIKGFVRIRETDAARAAGGDRADGQAYVDCVGDAITIKSPLPAGARWSEAGLVVIWKRAAPTDATTTWADRLRTAWERDVGLPAILE